MAVTFRLLAIGQTAESETPALTSSEGRMNESPRLSSFDREASELRSKMRFSVKFWGVRGSIACPGQSTARYGGNTPCLELRCGDRILILDGGTGLRPLGDALLKANTTLDA